LSVKEGIIVATGQGFYPDHETFNFAGGKRNENFKMRSMEKQQKRALEIGAKRLGLIEGNH